MLKQILFVFVVLKCAGSANILGIFPFGAHSHYILDSKLMKGLAEAGHEVTMVSPYKLKDLPKNGKFTDVILDGFAEEFEILLQKFNFLEGNTKNSFEAMKKIMNEVMISTNKSMNHPNVQKLLNSGKKFDAVILENHGNDALKVFSHIYNCPLIILSSIGPNSKVNGLVGNPSPIAYAPHMLVKMSKDFTLIDRAKNIFAYITDYVMNSYYLLPMHEKIIMQIFPDAPPLFELYTNVSLVLLNSHPSLNPAMPTVPNMVEIGGYFIDPPQKLPKDLQDFLNSAKDGVIYFSMGTNINSKDISEAKKKAILNVLGNLKHKVLWKFETELPEKPPNVMIRNWLPQQDILAHPNIKLFITHGGLLSTTETIYHGVPILVLPVFADQFANAGKAVEDGYGLMLEYSNFSEEKFHALLYELLTNPKYAENAQKRSKLFHDRPAKPMETAVYWVEYIIRHKGAPHLRVGGVNMPWYKYFMVDVIVFITITILMVLYITKLVFKKLFSKFLRNKSSKKLKTT